MNVLVLWMVTGFGLQALENPSIRAGAKLFQRECKSCHGEDGKADTKTGKKEKIADMTTDAWQKEWTDEKQKKMILDGSKDNKKMKPFKDKLSAEEVDGLVKFIRGLKT